MHLTSLIPDNVRAEIPVGAGPVAFVAHTFRHVEDNRDGQHVVVPSESDQRLSRFGLNVCRVNHCESCTGQPTWRGRAAGTCEAVTKLRLKPTSKKPSI